MRMGPVNNSILGQQLHSQSSPGDLAVAEWQRNGKFSQNGMLGHLCARVMKSRLYESRARDHVIVHLGLNVNSSAHNCGCVIDGGNAHSPST